MFVEQFLVDGLGCASYMIVSESSSSAAVVDPDRDVHVYLDAAQDRGVRITHIIETHLHADHVSGNTALKQACGAPIYIYAGAQVAFPHHPLHDGDVLELGEVRLLVRHTPGHTPDSITLLAADTTRSETPWMALTGDLLFVGDVGRPDLAGAENVPAMAADLFDSLAQRLGGLEDGVLIYPAHSSGSLCGKAIHSARVSSLGYERRFNRLLRLATRLGDKPAFIERLTKHLPEQPANHTLIKASNRGGPAVLEPIAPNPLDINSALPYFQRGAALLDTRPRSDYIARHVPGSVHLQAGPQLPNRIGFILSPEQPIVVLPSDAQEYVSVVHSLRRVGFEGVAGYLDGGLQAWEAAGLPLRSGDIEDLTAKELDLLLHAGGTPPVIVDVREPWEYARQRIPGARLMPLGHLAEQLSELDPNTPAAVVCAHGNRSQSAAALLGGKGFKKVYNLLDGVAGWERAGLPVESG